MTDIPPLLEPREPKDQQARVAVVSIAGITTIGIVAAVVAAIGLWRGQQTAVAVALAITSSALTALAAGLNTPGGVAGALRQVIGKGPSQ